MKRNWIAPIIVALTTGGVVEAASAPKAEDHKRAFKVLLLFTPETSKQRPYLIV